MLDVSACDAPKLGSLCTVLRDHPTVFIEQAEHVSWFLGSSSNGGLKMVEGIGERGDRGGRTAGEESVFEQDGDGVEEEDDDCGGKRGRSV